MSGAITDVCVVTAWSIVFFSWLHTIAHWNNFAQLAIKEKLGFLGWLRINFTSGPGWTGYVMMFCLMAMAFTAMDKPRRANFERFWYVVCIRGITGYDFADLLIGTLTTCFSFSSCSGRSMAPSV